MICIECAVGYHWWCHDGEICTCDPIQEALVGESKRIDGYKKPEDVTDVTSTGRKRAAKAFKIEEGTVCEWANLKFAGGGVYPIVGCLGNPATNRHHGPDKNTLNNTIGNVHRICATCHNRWHSLNDKCYPNKRPDGSVAFTPLPPWSNNEHDNTTLATIEEVMAYELTWRK